MFPEQYMPIYIARFETTSIVKPHPFFVNTMFIPENPILDTIIRGLVLGPLTLAWITLTARIVGLRTFSKMTAYDFVATIATGSLLAQAAGATDWSGFIQSTLAVFVILGVQRVIAAIRFRSNIFREAIENEPILLMSRGTFHRKSMKSVRVAEADIMAKIRQANVKDLEQVEAVVLETTGDISVIYGSKIEAGVLNFVERGPEYHIPKEQST